MNIIEKLRPNIVSYWDFRKGDIKDQIGSNHGSFNSTAPIFQNIEGLKFDGSDDHILVSDSASLDVNNVSVSVWIKLEGTPNYSNNQSLAMKGTASLTAPYGIRVTTTGKVQTRIQAAGGSEFVGNTASEQLTGDLWHFVVLTYDGTTQQIYIDANAKSSGTTATGNLNSTADDLYFGREADGSADLKGNIRNVVVFDKALSAQEVSELYEASKEEFGNIEQKQNFVLPDSVDNSDSDLVAGYNMRIAGGKVQDVTGTNSGTISGAVTQIKGIFGEGCSFDGTTGSINAGTSPVHAGQAMTLKCIFRESLAGAGDDRFIQHNQGNDGAFGFFVNNGTVTFRVDGGTEKDINVTLIRGKWHHLVGVIDGTGGAELFVNGNSVGTATGMGTTGAAATLYIGSRNGSAEFFHGDIDSVELYNVAKDNSWVTNDYNKFAETLMYRDSLQDTNVSRANNTANFLENTEFKISTGTWQVKYDSTEDDKYIDCVAAGINYMSCDQAYGTWEFDLYKPDAGVSRILFIADVIGSEGAAGQDSYQILVQADETLYLRKTINGTDSTIANSAVGVFTINSWQKIKITRRYDGQFNIYLDGVNHIVNQTENTTADCKYFILDLSTGARIKNFKFSRGVV